MSSEPKYVMESGTPPEPPELIEAQGVAATESSDGISEINRKLDAIMAALNIGQEEQK